MWQSAVVASPPEDPPKTRHQSTRAWGECDGAKIHLRRGNACVHASWHPPGQAGQLAVAADNETQSSLLRTRFPGWARGFAKTGLCPPPPLCAWPPGGADTDGRRTPCKKSSFSGV